MPRTKISKNATAKRPRNQMIEETHSSVLREIEQKTEAFQLDISIVHEQNINNIANKVQDMQVKMTDAIRNKLLAHLFSRKPAAANDMTSISADITAANKTNAGYSQLGRSRNCDEGKPSDFKNVFLRYILYVKIS